MKIFNTVTALHVVSQGSSSEVPVEVGIAIIAIAIIAIAISVWHGISN